MGQGRDRFDRRGGPGQSEFARRGQSHEERMRGDDSRYRFRDEPVSYVEERDRDYREPVRRGYYGSGGSYGYGGSYEHGGENGYQNDERAAPVHGDEQFFEATGGFGHDVGAYGRQGLGYPGQNEQRGGHPGQPRQIHREAERLERSGYRAEDDARRGFSQESGYAQSGGQRVGAEGADYGSSRQHADRFGHEGGGRRSQRVRTPYQGRMPQGYTRSDERIREDVCERLSHGRFDPSEVTVTVAQGDVTLEGFVESRGEKFHVEEVAASVLGVKDVHNHLRLRRFRDQPREQQPSKPTETTTKTRGGNNENGARG
jgi:hypothetical protein